MKSDKSRWYVPALVALALTASGCAAWLPLAPPEVSLVNLQFTDLKLFETTGVFTVRLSNENPEPVRVEGGVYKLYLDGVRVGKGLSDARLELPRLGSTTDRVTVHINNVAVATRLAAILKQPVVDYELVTRLYVAGSWGTRRVSSRFSGRLDLEAPAARGPEGLAADPPGPRGGPEAR